MGRGSADAYPVECGWLPSSWMVDGMFRFTSVEVVGKILLLLSQAPYLHTRTFMSSFASPASIHIVAAGTS